MLNSFKNWKCAYSSILKLNLAQLLCLLTFLSLFAILI